MRALKLDVNDTNHRRIRRRVAELGLDTSHFTRRPWGSVQTSRPKPMREKVLVVLPTGSARPSGHGCMQPYRIQGFPTSAPPAETRASGWGNRSRSTSTTSTATGWTTESRT
jgi:hypothetical protein